VQLKAAASTSELQRKLAMRSELSNTMRKILMAV